MLRPPSFLLLLALGASPVLAAPDATVHARRTPDKPTIDGRLEEAAWAAAPAYDRFTETFPQDGVPAAPEFRTEVKVLYDDEFLYVGVHAFDPEPNGIVGQLSRRDSAPPSDYIQVAINASGAGNTGFSFNLNAAGVQRDQLLYADVNSTDTWDAVWDGDVKRIHDGWTAEFAIPLRLLRFPKQANQQWGFHVRRVIPRLRQTLDSTYIPRNANSASTGGLVVSRFGKLVDLIDLEPKRELELSPYVAARATQRPQFSDPTRTEPTLIDPTIDVGLDLKASLTSGLNLSAAVNPDFGQVEADQLIQNVNTFEQFFPEKRPFFTQGLDLFQPVGSEYGTQQQLFYSRRIGIEQGQPVPILAAVKITGTVREGTEIGVLDAVVMGASNPSLTRLAFLGDQEGLSLAEADPDRRWQWQLAQPLRFGPNNALPATRPVTKNHFAAVVRQEITQGITVGATLTSSLPLGPACRREDFASDAEFASVDCSSFGMNAAALDFNARTADGVWGALGQVGLTQAVGGPETGRVLQDGTVLRAGDLGQGFYFRAGKLGGEPFRFNINGTFEPPNFDLNESGFQPFTNYQWYATELAWVRPHGFGPFKSARVGLNVDVLNFSADGRWIPRGRNASINAEVQLPSFDTVYTQIGFEDPQYDLREIPRSGVATERMMSAFAAIGVATDFNRRLQGQLNLVASRIFDKGQVAGAWGWQMNANSTWHPVPFLETYLAVDLVRRATGTRFVDQEADDAIFGTQHPGFFSATLRQQVVLTPKLTLQAYAQLFSGVITYGSFYRSTLAGRERIDVADLTPVSYTGNPNQHFSALNVNLVLRWEYRLGSTIYAVYTRSQQELPSPSGVPSTSLFPSRLDEGPVTQTALVKWSYWWDV